MAIRAQFIGPITALLVVACSGSDSDPAAPAGADGSTAGAGGAVGDSGTAGASVDSGSTGDASAPVLSGDGFAWSWNGTDYLADKKVTDGWSFYREWITIKAQSEDMANPANSFFVSAVV